MSSSTDYTIPKIPVYEEPLLEQEWTAVLAHLKKIKNSFVALQYVMTAVLPLSLLAQQVKQDGLSNIFDVNSANQSFISQIQQMFNQVTSGGTVDPTTIGTFFQTFAKDIDYEENHKPPLISSGTAEQLKTQLVNLVNSKVYVVPIYGGYLGNKPQAPITFDDLLEGKGTATAGVSGSPLNQLGMQIAKGWKDTQDAASSSTYSVYASDDGGSSYKLTNIQPIALQGLKDFQNAFSTLTANVQQVNQITESKLQFVTGQYNSMQGTMKDTMSDFVQLEKTIVNATQAQG